MTEKIEILIPVSPYEPERIIRESVKSLKQLEMPEGLQKQLHYIIDTDKHPEDDERVEFLNEEASDEVNVVVRTTTRGRRAGALNEGLEQLEDPEYVAIFDIDSRPGKNFLKACKVQLDSSEEVFMSTCPRKILNPDRNFVTRLVDAEYDFLMDMQKLLDRTEGFNHFNGLIAVLDGQYLMEKGFDESRMCEDTDLTQRAYLDGKRPALNTESYVGEQAVTNFPDLYNQKLRWMNGAIEGLRHFTKPFISSNLSLKVKVSWFSAMAGPFFSALFSPFAFVHSAFKAVLERRISTPLSRGVHLFIFAWFITFCGIVNIFRSITGKGVEWKASDREL